MATQGPLYWNALLYISFGSMYCAVLGLHLLYKAFLNENGIGEGPQLASYILGWTEFVALVVILLASIYSGKRRKDLIKMYNEIWKYTKFIQGNKVILKFKYINNFSNFNCGHYF